MHVMAANKLQLWLLIAYCLIRSTIAEDYEITNYKNGSGLYYENIGEAYIYVRDFNIVTFYDLERYYKNYDILLKNIHALNNYCGGSNPYCNRYNQILREGILTNLARKHQLIGDFVEISDVPVKEKRFWIGAPTGDQQRIFGVMDAGMNLNGTIEEVEKYRQDVNHSQKVVEHQMYLYENLHTDANYEFELIAGKLGNINSEYPELPSRGLSIEHAVRTGPLIQYTNAILQLFSTMQSDLLECLTLAHQGVLHPIIISPKILQNKLLEVKKYFKNDSNTAETLEVTAQNANAIFNMIKPIIYRKNQTIIFDFIVPLITESYYDIYKLTSAPVLINDDIYAYIYPEEPYLFVEKSNGMHFFLDRHELDKCNILDKMQYICKRVKPLHVKNTTCEHKLISNSSTIPENCDVKLITIHQTLFIELEGEGSWLFVAPNKENLRVYCSQDLQRTDIQGTGTINVNFTCHKTETDLVILREYWPTNLARPKHFQTYTPSASLKDFVGKVENTQLLSTMKLMVVSRSETIKFTDVGTPLHFMRVSNQHITATFKTEKFIYYTG